MSDYAMIEKGCSKLLGRNKGRDYSRSIMVEAKERSLQVEEE